MELTDRNFIQIIYDLTIIRVYYIEKQFYISLVDEDAIRPAMFKKSYKARNFLVDLLKNKKNVDMKIYYRTDMKMEKKIQIHELMGYYHDDDDIEKLIHRLLLLLI